jgi:ABC-type sugar transport system permease subunit
MFLNLYKLYYPTQDSMSFRPQYGYGAAVSIVTAIIVGAVTVIFLRLSKKLDDIY